MKRREQRKAAAVKYAQSVQSTFTNDVEYVICTNDFEAGWEFADLTPRWISVEDELPKDDSLVLTITHSGSQRVGFYNDGWWMASVNISRMGSVTHWMLLPQPPSSSEIPNNCEKGGEQ